MKYFIICLTIFLLAACQGKSGIQEPLDTGMIKTEAVQTAIAEITVQAILNPSPTARAIFTTPVPVVAIISEVKVSTPEPTPTLQKPTATAFEPFYACEVDHSNSLPDDGPQPAGAKVNKEWVIRNSGNIEWTSERVEVKWVGGVNLCSIDCVERSETVAPGETFSFNIDLLMPVKATDKPQIVQWGLVNPANEIFCKLYFVIPYVY